MSNPYMCGSAMGMVFCPADYSFNGGTGFSLLFKSWVIHDGKSYILACLGVFAIGVARQLLVGLRTIFLEQSNLKKRRNSGEQEPMLRSEGGVGSRALLTATDTGLFALGLFMSYLSMLVAMSFDFGLLFSLVAGEALTYGAFSMWGDKWGHAPHATPLTEELCCT